MPLIPPGNSVQGSGLQQFKAVVLGWIREEIGKAAQGGAGLHVDGATKNLIVDQGEVQSGNYVAGSTGWALLPTGDGEFDGVSISSIAATVANLGARVTRTVTIPSFNTGSLPNDSTFHAYGSSLPITIDVPTGTLVVTVGAGQATIATSAGAVTAEATFSISGSVAADGDVYARGYAVSPVVVGGSSLSVVQSFTVPPGTYTVTGQMRAWASGTSTGSVNFSKPFLTVQVTG